MVGRLMVLIRSNTDIDQKNPVGARDRKFLLTPRTLFASDGSMLMYLYWWVKTDTRPWEISKNGSQEIVSLQ